MEEGGDGMQQMSIRTSKLMAGNSLKSATCSKVTEYMTTADAFVRTIEATG